jgi:hypothetical protein
MLQAQLKAEQFQAYPPLAQALAVDNIALFRQLPQSFVPFLLKEVISYDWKFPAERLELTQQLTYLKDLPPAQLDQEMAPFAGLRLSKQLESFDWVNAPGQYLEQLSANLWATHQMDGFRAASEGYVHKFHASLPPETLPLRRLGIVVVGEGVTETKYRLFRKVRRQGVYFPQVKPENGLQTVLEAVQARAASHPVPFAHWYIDGGDPALVSAALTCVSYPGMASARRAINAKMRKAYDSAMPPEAFRTMLAQMGPDDLGMHATGNAAVLDHFEVTLLTEGSGTQVFSTTFVQWAAREALRRAKPLTLMARFAPRERERPMNELLLASSQKPSPDPEGALVDADMGAWYTWLNLQRLPGADQSAFLVWFEGHNQAVITGPSLPHGTVDTTPIDLQGLLRKIS